eukprot:COSAG06_NODE_6948_length_2703_cov_1.789939_2_plen_406_part_00
MEIVVRAATGATHTFELEGSVSIAKVKAKICSQGVFGYPPPAQQRLVYAGFQLEDGNTLAELTKIQYCTDRVELRLDISLSSDLGVQLAAERVQREERSAEEGGAVMMGEHAGGRATTIEYEPEPEPEPPRPRAAQAGTANRAYDKRRRLASLSVEYNGTEEEQEANALVAADKPLPPGTRIAVAGHGTGSYVSCEERWLGANDHTITFDGGSTVVLQLRELDWTVFEREMDAMVTGLAEPALEPEPEPEPEPELGVSSNARSPTGKLPEGSPPTKSRDKAKHKKKKKKHKPKATAAPPPGAAPPPPPPPPPPPTADPSAAPKANAAGGGRGDLLAAIENGGLGMLKKTSATAASSTTKSADRAAAHTETQKQQDQSQSQSQRSAEYGPPWNKKPPAGLDMFEEM